MKEVKFRGKRLTDGAWIYGSLVNIEEDRYAVLPVINTMRDETIAMYEVDPDTVGQYTGLKDKNGKEIYEGDIIEVDWLGEPSIVKWYKDGFMAYPYRSIGYHLCEVVADCKVIGNIHDNPELIKEK